MRLTAHADREGPLRGSVVVQFGGSRLVTTTFQFDNNGNVTQKTVDGTTTTYIYDYANRLTALGVAGGRRGYTRPADTSMTPRAAILRLATMLCSPMARTSRTPHLFPPPRHPRSS